MLSLIRSFGDAFNPAICDPNFTGPLTPAMTQYCQDLQKNADAVAIANAIKAGVGIYNLPQQLQTAQLQAQQAALLQQQQQSQALLAQQMAQRGQQIPGQTNWLLYGGIGAAVLVLAIVLAARR